LRLSIVAHLNLYQVLLTTHSGLPELVLLCYILLLLLHRDASPFHHLLSLPLPLLKARS